MSDELKALLERYRAATIGLPSDVSVADIEKAILDWHQQELERAVAEARSS